VKAETTGIQAVAQQAQRAVLIPVGATLTARDNVVETVRPFVKRTSARREVEKLQRRVGVNLRRYERRGTTARNRVERQVKRTRTQFERELRQRRNQVQRTVKRNRRDLERDIRSARRDVESFASDLSPLS
jgi:hypothetical protein